MEQIIGQLAAESRFIGSCISMGNDDECFCHHCELGLPQCPFWRRVCTGQPETHSVKLRADVELLAEAVKQLLANEAFNSSCRKRWA